MPVVTTKFYLYPFATAGTVTAVPDGTQLSGAVSYQQGYGVNYTLQLGMDPAALAFPEPQHNQLLLDATVNLRQYQQWGTPNFILAAQNLTVNYPYDKWAYALYDDGTNGPRVYQSLGNTNSTLPTSILNWRIDDNNAGSVNYNATIFEGTVVNGNIVYYNSGTAQYTKAVANGTAAQNAIGFADVTNGRVIAMGNCFLMSGLTPGDIYYLSTATPGAITTTVPPDNIVQVGTAFSSTEFLVNIVSNTAVVPNVLASMYGSTAQAITTTSPVVLNFNTVEFDSYSLCNTGSHTITVNLTGKWEITAFVNAFFSSNVASGAFIGIYKNGSLIKTIGNLDASGAGAAVLGASLIISATAGDVFDIRSELSVASNQLNLFAAGATDSSFQAEFLGT